MLSSKLSAVFHVTQPPTRSHRARDSHWPWQTYIIERNCTPPSISDLFLMRFLSIQTIGHISRGPATSRKASTLLQHLLYDQDYGSHNGSSQGIYLNSIAFTSPITSTSNNGFIMPSVKFIIV